MLRSGIDWCSTASVYIEMYFGDSYISRGSAFLTRREIGFSESKLTGPTHLITNRHNVTGLDSRNISISSSGRRPDRLRIWVYRENGWISIEKNLYRAPGEPVWFEHPRFGRRIDIVALELQQPAAAITPAYDAYTNRDTPISWGISSELKVIGFPYRLDKIGGVPVWTRGTVATEPSVPYQHDRKFLIDSRTRRGQSGSPVVLWSDGTSFPNDNGTISKSTTGKSIHSLVGVYSGRVDEQSDLGIVWSVDLVTEILELGVRPTGEDLMSSL